MDIDNGLFQLVTLALLGVTLLVLVVTLLSLNKLGKKLEEGLGASAGHTPRHDEHAHHDHEHSDEPHQDEPGGAVDDWSPATAQYPTATTDEPAPETVGAASVTAGETPAGFNPPGEAAQEPAAATPEPAATEAAPVEEREAAPVAQEPEPVVAEPSQTGTGFEDAPEEQPFERDGRWWFKRGNEILVYDEQTGQWGPAPAAAPVGAGSVPVSGDATWSQEEQAQGWGQPEPSSQQGEAAAPASTFWKCPSCGAINGATATACRMCFTPKA